MEQQQVWNGELPVTHDEQLGDRLQCVVPSSHVQRGETLWLTQADFFFYCDEGNAQHVSRDNRFAAFNTRMTVWSAKPLSTIQKSVILHIVIYQLAPKLEVSNVGQPFSAGQFVSTLTPRLISLLLSKLHLATK